MSLILASRMKIQSGTITVLQLNARGKKGRWAQRGREGEQHKSNFCCFSESYLQQWETETARGREWVYVRGYVRERELETKSERRGGVGVVKGDGLCVVELRKISKIELLLKWKAIIVLHILPEELMSISEGVVNMPSMACVERGDRWRDDGIKRRTETQAPSQGSLELLNSPSVTVKVEWREER